MPMSSCGRIWHCGQWIDDIRSFLITNNGVLSHRLAECNFCARSVLALREHSRPEGPAKWRERRWRLFSTDPEVFQEILHRYGANRRRDAIQPAFDALLGVIDDVFPIEQCDVLMAKDIMLGYSMLSARDALHLAVMDRHHCERILSFDSGFDSYPGIIRITERL